MPPCSTTTTILENQPAHQKHIQQEYVTHTKGSRFLIWEFQMPLIWRNIIAIVLLHILGVYAMVTHSYLEEPGIVLYGVLVGMVGGFGITAGVHRLWTHRSYKAKLPLKLILLFCYSVAGQNSLKDWVQDHRVHHKFSETDADPHNSRRGFFFAHVGWLMMKKHPDVIRKGRLIDYSDLWEDPVVVFYQKHFLWFKLVCCFILPTIIPPLAWGESWFVSIKAIVVARYMLGLNYTWLVNSAAHIWGNKPYDKNICPTENLLVSLLAIGEGYHNFHHTFPWDYRASEMGKYLNLTTYLLDFFQKIGWVYDTKTTSPELVRKVVERSGDGTHDSHYRWGQEISEEELLKTS